MAAADRVIVNDEETRPGVVTDNFFPALTVTPGPSGTAADTLVHVMFYDDRNFPFQVDDPKPLEPKFDVFYAYSLDGGLTFSPQTDWELYQDPYETCVDYELVDPNRAWAFRDYNGIAAQVDGSGYRIWTSFAGTHADDQTLHKSVIYSSQIPWASP